MGRWILYVDESGPFDKGLRTGFVGGVLLDVSTKAVDVATLKRALSMCYPIMPWPLHATDTRRPMAHVAAAMISGYFGPELAAQLSSIRALVERASVGDLASFRDAVARGLMPDQPVLDRAFAELSALAPELARQIIEYATGRFAVSHSLMRALASTLDGRIFAVGAASAPGQSYASAFTRCVQRTLELLRRKVPPQHSLLLTVAARRMSDGELGTREDLLRWAAEAAALRDGPLGSPMPDVELSADVPKHMTSEVSPWLVLADFVCNRLVNPVHAAASWEELESVARERLGLPLRMVAERLECRLPTLAYESARDCPAPGWARDQARQWDTAARRSP